MIIIHPNTYECYISILFLNLCISPSKYNKNDVKSPGDIGLRLFHWCFLHKEEGKKLYMSSILR